MSISAKEYPLPENGYHAEDVKHIAEDIAAQDGDKWLTADPAERLEYFMNEGKTRELEKIDRDLKLYRVTMQSWMHETFFYENNAKRINDCLKMMDEKGLLYEKGRRAVVQKAPITATIRTACCARATERFFISHAGYRKPRLQSVSADIKS